MKREHPTTTRTETTERAEAPRLVVEHGYMPDHAKPISFHERSMQSIKTDRKNQTRRPIDPQPPSDLEPLMVVPDETGLLGVFMWGPDDQQEDRIADYEVSWPKRGDGDHPEGYWKSPYGDRGAHLWVREPHRFLNRLMVDGDLQAILVEYAADGETRWCAVPEGWEGSTLPTAKGKTRPGMYLPKWACRCVLEVERNRVQRIQDILPEDVIREGYPVEQWEFLDGDPVAPDLGALMETWRTAWDSMYEGSWKAWENNPWVVCVEFSVEWHAFETHGLNLPRYASRSWGGQQRGGPVGDLRELVA